MGREGYEQVHYSTFTHGSRFWNSATFHVKFVGNTWATLASQLIPASAAAYNSVFPSGQPNLHTVP